MRTVVVCLIAGAAACAAADDMVLVPAGTFVRGGTDYADEGPVREVWVDAFWIDRHEVTNAAYARFDPSHRFAADQADLPVTDVTWYEARDYASWAGKHLPTEIEWEKAARGTDGRRWPWGNVFDASRCHTWRPGTYFFLRPVGSFPDGASPYGVEDMAGNAIEWTASSYLPYDGHDVEWPAGAASWCVVRGGFTEQHSRCAFRGFRIPYYRDSHHGFRCVRDATTAAPAPAQDRDYLDDLPNPACERPTIAALGAPVTVRVDAARTLGPLHYLNRRVSQPSTDEAAEIERMLPLIRDMQVEVLRLDMLHGDEATLKADGSVVIDWKRADAYFDLLDRLGIRIIYQLAHAPAFVSREGSPGDYEPSDLDAWAGYVRAVVRHVRLERDESILGWEIWGEPDLVRSQTDPADIDAFLRFWGATAHAILDVDPGARLAGPATVIPTPQWTERFYEYLVANDLPVDVVTWHLYNAPPWRYQQEAATTRKLLSRFPQLGHPDIGITEWNAFAGHMNVNDDHFGAAHTAVNLILLQDGSIRYPMFFQLFDGWDFLPPVVDEEFWGRWGMITFAGRPKAVCNFYQLMNRLGPERVHITTTQPDLWVLAAEQRGAVQVLLVDYRVPLNVVYPGWMPNPAGAEEQTVWFGPPQDPMSGKLPDQPCPVTATRTVALNVDGLFPATTRRYRRYLIDAVHSNAYHDVARADLECVEDVVVSASGTGLSLNFELAPYAITLIELDAAPRPALVLTPGENGPIRRAVAGETLATRWRVEQQSDHPVFPVSFDVRSWETTLSPVAAVPERIAVSDTLTLEARGTLRGTGRPGHQVFEAVLGYRDRRGGLHEARSSWTVYVEPALDIRFPTPCLDLPGRGAMVAEIRNRSSEPQHGTLTLVPPLPDLAWKPAKLRVNAGQTRRVVIPLEIPQDRHAMADLFCRAETQDEVYPIRHLTVATGIQARRRATIQIDGNVEDWPADDWFEVPGAMHDRPLSGDSDCQARFALGYDDRALYLAVEVADDHFVQNAEGAAMWQGDSVQLALDPLRDPSRRDGYNADDVEYGIALTQKGPQVWCWAPGLAGATGVQPDIRVAVMRNNGTTTYELALSWSQLRPLDASWTAPFGMCLLINDHDGGGDRPDRGYLEWGGQIGHGKRPAGFLPVWLSR